MRPVIPFITAATFDNDRVRVRADMNKEAINVVLYVEQVIVYYDWFTQEQDVRRMMSKLHRLGLITHTEQTNILNVIVQMTETYKILYTDIH